MNATFGSITEMTFYITALIQGHRADTKCYEEVVKAALTGTLLGCILFIPVRMDNMLPLVVMKYCRRRSVADRGANCIKILAECFNCTGCMYDHRGYQTPGAAV